MASELNRRVKRWPGWVALIFVVAGLLAVGATRDSGPQSQSDRIDELSKRVACPICDGESVFESQNSASEALRNTLLAATPPKSVQLPSLPSVESMEYCQVPLPAAVVTVTEAGARSPAQAVAAGATPAAAAAGAAAPPARRQPARRPCGRAGSHTRAW